MDNDYVHGYSGRENARLYDQAITLTELLHVDTLYPAGSNVLEAGCGVGAQTKILAKNNLKSNFTSIDISSKSIEKAKKLIEEEKINNVNFIQGNIFDLPFEKESFDHIFVCFVLEHLKEPLKALDKLKYILKPEGSITVIEGDHGSTFFYPDSEYAHKTIKCLIDIQGSLQGNSLIGRELYPLLQKVKFKSIRVSPRMVYADSSKPEMVEGFTKNTFIAMVEGIKEQALDLKMIDESDWEKGINDLYRTTQEDGVFCYTFFKAVGYK